jgi:hypothetical protein
MILTPLIGYIIISLININEFKHNYEKGSREYNELLFITGYILLTYGYYSENDKTKNKMNENDVEQTDIESNKINYAHILLSLYYLHKIYVNNDRRLLNFCMLLAHISLIYVTKNRIGLFVYMIGYLLEMNELMCSEQYDVIELCGLCLLVIHYLSEIIEITKEKNKKIKK